MTTARQTTRSPDDVKKDDAKKPFVVCNCGCRAYLGPWGAAHVGIYELSATCGQCNGTITITRSTHEPE